MPITILKIALTSPPPLFTQVPLKASRGKEIERFIGLRLKSYLVTVGSYKSKNLLVRICFDFQESLQMSMGNFRV